jgi:prepilin peptidase CpaA
LVAAVVDVRTRKIPNAIPIALALFGLAFYAFAGWRVFLLALLAGILVLAIGTLPFGLGLIGGGDVKLLAACGCALGLSRVLPLVVYTAILGGVLALIAAIGAGQLRRTFVRVGRLVAPALSLGSAPETAAPLRLPYAVAIAGGVSWLFLGETLLPALKILK